MPTVGDQLRAAREARKLRVKEVAEATKMRADHIVALEEGNYTPFPAPVYIRGSVRTYAKLLKLDVMPIMDALAAELNQGGQAEQRSNTAHRRRNLLDVMAFYWVRFGWKRIVIALIIPAALVILLVIRAGRSGQPETDPLADLPPPTYQPADGAEDGYLPLPGTNQ